MAASTHAARGEKARRTTPPHHLAATCLLRAALTLARGSTLF